MIILKISDCSRLAQKEHMTKHYLVGKVIQLELCKKLYEEMLYAQYRIRPGK